MSDKALNISSPFKLLTMGRVYLQHPHHNALFCCRSINARQHSLATNFRLYGTNQIMVPRVKYFFSPHKGCFDGLAVGADNAGLRVP